jgi:hypothetical protein
MRRRRSSSTALVLGLLLATAALRGTAQAAPPNDAFASASVVDPSVASVAGVRDSQPADNDATAPATKVNG